MKVNNDEIKKIVFSKTLELLSKFGVRGWNMDDLARESNMSKRTLYKIIGNKEDLIIWCIVDGMHETYTHLENLLKSSKPFPEILNLLVETITNHFQEYIIKNISVIRVEFPKIKIKEDEYYIKRRKLWLTFLKNGKKEGYLVDYARPEAIYKTVNAIVAYYVSTCENQTDFKNEINETLGLFFKGLLK